MAFVTLFRGGRLSGHDGTAQKPAGLSRWAPTTAPRRRLLFLVLIGSTALAMIAFIGQGVYATDISRALRFRGNGSQPIASTQTKTITMLFVVCGNYYDLSVVAVKSAIAYSYSKLHLIIVSDEGCIDRWRKEVEGWPETIRRRVRADVRELQYPSNDVNYWRYIHKLCSTQKLFLSSMLPEEDVVLYVDVDFVFVHPVEDVWQTYTAMTERQIAAMVLDTTRRYDTWPVAEVSTPSAIPLALNTGLILMNLTRMREFDFERRVADIWREHGGRTLLRDSQLLDIIFTRYPELVHALDPRWNFRRGNCRKNANGTGQPIAAVHGDEDIFLAIREPAFVAVHSYMHEYKLGTSLAKTFIRPLKKALDSHKHALCSREFLRQLPTWYLAAIRMDCVTGRTVPENSSEHADFANRTCSYLVLT